MFLLTLHFMPKSAKFQNNCKNDFPSGTWAPSRGTTFLSEILILVSSISYFSMVEKAKWFDGKKMIFQKIRLKISKILKFCNPREIFSIFFWQ